MECVEHSQKGVGLGYGTTSYQGKTVRWHRLIYCQHNNCTLDSIKGKLVRHTCDNPRCINPEHLRLGTQQDNMDDKVARRRQARGTTHYDTHLSKDDVLFIRSSKGVISAKALAKRFGIAIRTVYYILDGTNWKDGEYSSQ